MGKISVLLLSVAILAISCSSEMSVEEKKKLQKEALEAYGVVPEKMPGSEDDTQELVDLGKKLYFEKRLSVNDTQSCNDCHRIDHKLAGVDNLPVSPGAIEGKKGERNSPTVFNAGFHFALFWDGRAEDLLEQAKGPILNPVEMAMPSGEAVEKKFRKIEEYQEPFKKAFPDQGNPITFDNVAKAIAAFERTLRTTDRFDDFLNGDMNALSELELEGLKTFKEVGCTTCHTGPMLGANMYQKVGVHVPYENTEDTGRHQVTGKAADKYMFKAPSLRNVALTAPYFHDGSVETLKEAVEEIAWLQLGKRLKPQETKSILAFLRALSGKGLVAEEKIDEHLAKTPTTN